MYIFTPKKLTQAYIEIFESLGFTISKQAKDIILPFGENSNKDLDLYINSPEIKYSLQFPDVYLLAKKTELWINMLNFWGLQKTLKYLPQTYILNTKKDETILNILSSSSNKKFIAKGNKQRRQTIKIIDAHEIQDLLNSKEFKLIQEIIDSRNIINERAFNIRMFLIFTYSDGKFKSYVSSNGKLIYSNDSENMISQTEFYDESLPLLLFDIFSDKFDINRKSFYFQLKDICKAVSEMYEARINNQKLIGGKSFCQLFGIDLILDQNHQLKLLEINNRPQIKSNNNRDKSFKNSVFRDCTNHFLLKRDKPTIEWLETY